MKKIRPLEIIIFLLCLAVFLFSAWRILSHLKENHAGKKEYETIYEKYVKDDSEPDSTESDSLKAPKRTIDFSSLEKINPEIKGWIFLPGTPIDYPVVQGTDNEYYLSHLYDHSENKNGTPFIDMGNQIFQDDNTILYGHHMKNGSMFASLMNYEEQTFYDAHPYVYLYTPDCNYVIQLFAGVVIEGASDLYTIDFASKEDRSQWVDNLIKNSSFQSKVTIDNNDSFMTLSTCAYYFENARYAVVGRLIKANTCTER